MGGRLALVCERQGSESVIDSLVLNRCKSCIVLAFLVVWLRHSWCCFQADNMLGVIVGAVFRLIRCLV